MIKGWADNKRLLYMILLTGSLALGIASWVGYSLWNAADAQAQSGWRTANEDMRQLLVKQSEIRTDGKADGVGAKSKTPGTGATAASDLSSRKAATGSTSTQQAASGTTTSSSAQEGNQTATGKEEVRSEELQSQEASTASVSSESVGKTAQVKAGSTNNTKLRLNTATAQELTVIPGIGDSKARAITAYREQIGGHFKRVEQLLEVKGIGEKLLDKMKPYITLDP